MLLGDYTREQRGTNSHVRDRVRVLEGAERPSLAIADPEDEVAGAVRALNASDGIGVAVVVLEDVAEEEDEGDACEGLVA
jgi:hypothetical protein